MPLAEFPPNFLGPNPPPESWKGLALVEREQAGTAYGHEIGDARPSYFTIHMLEAPEVRKLYQFRTSTDAGSQKDFYIIGSLNNRLKQPSDIEEVITRFQTFTAAYTAANSVFLVGDFYIWKYAMQYLWKHVHPLISLPWYVHAQ